MTENVCKTCHGLIYRNDDGDWQHADAWQGHTHEAVPTTIQALADLIEQEEALHRETMGNLWRAVGTLMKLEREQKRMKQRTLGERVGFTGAGICLLENGPNRTPVKRLRDIAEVLENED